MKPTNPTLNALLASRQFYRVDLYTLVLVDGTTYRWAAADANISYGGNTWDCGGQTGPFFEISKDTGGRVTWSTGLNADSMNVEVAPGASQILGIPFAVACRFGVLDGATLQRDLAIMSNYGDTSAGLVTMFFGRIVEIDIGDQLLTLNVNAPTELLDQQLPRNLFQPGCVNTLFDASCTLLQNSFREAFTIGAGSTQRLLLLSGPTKASSYYDQGKVIFTSGQANGEARSIRSWALGTGGALGTANIWPPLAVAPIAGDTGYIYAGCDKTLATCQNKFNNLANFRGFPDVPVPETSL